MKHIVPMIAAAAVAFCLGLFVGRRTAPPAPPNAARADLAYPAPQASEIERTEPEFALTEQEPRVPMADVVSESVPPPPASDPDLAPDGKPWSTSLQIEGEPYRVEWNGRVKRLYFPTGELYAQVGYENGKREGESRSWYRNGQLGGVEQWHEGRRMGPSIHYSDSGSVLMRGQYEHGYRHGLFETWSREGRRESIGSYRSAPERRSQFEVGQWTYWNPDGSIDDRRSGTYEDGQRVGP